VDTLVCVLHLVHSTIPTTKEKKRNDIRKIII
jgi:hypothetical protein